MLVGFQKLEKDFKRLLKDDNLFHSYLFFGKKGLGKSSFALSLANFFENGKFEIPEKILREAIVLESGYDNKSDDIKIEDIRELNKFLYSRPSASKYRCAIIKDGDKLNTYAQDALLKMLEEPPSHGVIFVTVSDTNSLKDTLLSRFEKIYIPPHKKEDILDFIQKYGRISLEEANNIAVRSNGSIGRAFKILSKDEIIEKAYNLSKDILKRGSNDRNVISNVLGVLSDKDSNNSIVNEFFEEILIKLRENVENNYKIIDEVSKTIFFMNYIRANKYIHLKNILWKIRLHLQLHH